MHRFRGVAVVALVASAVLGGPLVPAAGAADPGAIEPEVELVAYLDGRPLPLRLVGRYYCDDFSYPVIQCSTEPGAMEARASLALLAGIDYVTIYDQQTFAGAWMHVSQDYAALVTIGWNDRISSFKARNFETGRFTVDWLFAGTSWPFCCNSQITGLGAYDNTFSSVQRT